MYPGEYPPQTGTRIILKVKPEPVDGNPGFQTKSNGFNEYSGNLGTPTTRVRSRSMRDIRNGRQGVLRFDVETRTITIEIQSVFKNKSKNYRVEINAIGLPLGDCVACCAYYLICTYSYLVLFLHSAQDDEYVYRRRENAVVYK